MMTYEVRRFIAKNAALAGAAINAVEVTALNRLVKEMKTAGLWPTSGALYPFIGDAITQSLNLLDPDNYRITWSNDNSSYHATATGFTASSTAYGNTGLAPSVLGRNMSIAVYQRSTTASGNLDVGVNSSATSRVFVAIYYTGGTCYFDCFNASTERMSATVSPAATAQGLWVLTNNAGAASIYRNGTSFATATLATAATIPTASLFIGSEPAFAINSTGRSYGLVLIGPAYSTGQQSILYTAVQNFNTRLARNV